MINTQNKNIKWNYILLYILPLSLVFYATLCQLYGETNFLFKLLLKTRGISVIILSLIGFIMTKRFHGGNLSRVALFFSAYCFLSTILVSTPQDVIAICATIFFWPVTLWIGEKSYFSTRTFELSAVIIAVICNLMSVTTVLGRSNIELLESMELNQIVGAMNSIYLVLSTFPFVFLVSNRKLKLGLLILPIIAFLVSGKTTCIGASLISTIYFFFNTIHGNNKRKKLIMIIIILCSFFYVGNYFVDFKGILEDVNLDLDSGGNGRVGIIENVFAHYVNKGFINQILGSGFFAVAVDTQLSAHNDFLEVLYDYGLIGFILFLIFWYQLIQKRKQLPCGTNIYIVYNLSLIIYMSSCLASNFIVQQINMLFFALLWGTIDKYSIISKKQIL